MNDIGPFWSACYVMNSIPNLMHEIVYTMYPHLFLWILFSLIFISIPVCAGLFEKLSLFVT